MAMRAPDPLVPRPRCTLGPVARVSLPLVRHQEVKRGHRLPPVTPLPELSSARSRPPAPPPSPPLPTPPPLTHPLPPPAHRKFSLALLLPLLASGFAPAPVPFGVRSASSLSAAE